MFMSYYALEKMVEIRIAERREEAAREWAIAAAERPAQPEPPSPIRWAQVQILGR
jgi:hypothetical protein